MDQATADGHREQDRSEEPTRAQATDEEQHITQRPVAIGIQSHRALLFCKDNAEPRRRVPRCGRDIRRTAALRKRFEYLDSYGGNEPCGSLEPSAVVLI
jgi:hypothetical protein